MSARNLNSNAFSPRAFAIGERIEAGDLVIPFWPGKAIVTVGFILLVVATLVRMFGKADDGSV